VFTGPPAFVIRLLGTPTKGYAPSPLPEATEEVPTPALPQEFAGDGVGQ
jgi:hypothetical protein